MPRISVKACIVAATLAAVSLAGCRGTAAPSAASVAAASAGSASVSTDSPGPSESDAASPISSTGTGSAIEGGIVPSTVATGTPGGWPLACTSADTNGVIAGPAADALVTIDEIAAAVGLPIASTAAGQNSGVGSFDGYESCIYNFTAPSGNEGRLEVNLVVGQYNGKSAAAQFAETKASAPLRDRSCDGCDYVFSPLPSVGGAQVIKGIDTAGDESVIALLGDVYVELVQSNLTETRMVNLVKLILSKAQ